MTEGSNPIHSKHVMVVVGDLHAADFMLLEIGRRTDGYKTSLPGGFYDFDDRLQDYRLGCGPTDDLESASPEIVEGMRAILADRMQPSDFLGDPFFFDRSGSMPDDMLRAMATEVHSIMGDFFPMEMAPREIEDRMASLFDSPFAREVRELRLEYVEDMVMAKRTAMDVRYFERDTHGGTPRSIKETRRAQGRGKKANAMRGWKRK